MSTSESFNQDSTHVVFLPSGIGNMTPFHQLSVIMTSHNCKVTYINIQEPQANEPNTSNFFSEHTGIELLNFKIHPLTTCDTPTTNNPFIAHLRSIRQSFYELVPTLSRLPVCAIFSDFVIADTLTQFFADINIPLYIVSTTSAKFFSVVAYLPVLMNQIPKIFSNYDGDIQIPGLASVVKSSIPLTWMQDSSSNYLLSEYLIPNAQALFKANGVLSNTFDWFEMDTLEALNEGRVLKTLPPVAPIGPLHSFEFHESEYYCPWLNQQPAKSVVFVDLESIETMPKDQIRELEKGLQICGHSFLLVHKLDHEFNQDFPSISSDSERIKKGKTIKGCVNQDSILALPAIGAFVNECTWGSAMNAAWHGVPMLTWPHHGDQKINAETVENAGLGIFVKDWGWVGEALVEGEEIGQKLKQIMEDLEIRKKAKLVKERAREARARGGSSNKALMAIIESFKGKCEEIN